MTSPSTQTNASARIAELRDRSRDALARYGDSHDLSDFCEALEWETAAKKLEISKSHESARSST